MEVERKAFFQDGTVFPPVVPKEREGCVHREKEDIPSFFFFKHLLIACVRPSSSWPSPLFWMLLFVPSAASSFTL